MSAVPKPQGAIPKHNFIRDTEYRRHVAAQPCLICGAIDVQASHIRLGLEGGLGLKPPDDLCWPLCVGHHAEFDRGQDAFLKKHFSRGTLLKWWRREVFKNWVAA